MSEAVRRAHVDANVILRLLLGEPPEQAQAAKVLFERAARGELVTVIHPVVFGEVVYVLTSPRLGAHPRTRVAEVLRGLCALPGVEVVDLDVVLRALRRFEQTRLDWTDSLLLAYAPAVPVYTFDRAMIAAGGLLPG
ncbi:MAG: PIN domain-containing protein [Firmicutes bacterium]|nr:PIN domain-containing protein [Alicyclobacillaceae bacterium]MCL6498345.1 PIN domain-containing protein [Bacillota bacterium]